MRLIKYFLIIACVFVTGLATILLYPPALNFAIEVSGIVIDTEPKQEQDLSVTELQELLSQTNNNIVLIDVRTAAEYLVGHIDGAISIPLSDIEKNIGKIKAITMKKQLVTYCAMGPRSHKALSILKQHDIIGADLSGGFQAWWQHTTP